MAERRINDTEAVHVAEGLAGAVQGAAVALAAEATSSK